MFKPSVISALAVGLALGTASMAHAETKAKVADFTVRAEAPVSAGSTGSLKWDARRGRWGVTFNMEQPVGRDTQWNDFQAGAYFRVTPSIQVGGAVALGEREVPQFKKTLPIEGAPRVRLETAFKF